MSSTTDLEREQRRERHASNPVVNAVRKSNELTARLEAQGIPSEASENTYNMLVGAVLVVTVGKSKDGRQRSIYKSQSDLVKKFGAVSRGFRA